MAKPATEAFAVTRLSGRPRATLDRVFNDPLRSNVIWADVEALMKACGAELEEGRGSRVRVALRGVRAVFHRPHPAKETDKGALKSVRRFPMTAGVLP